MASVIKEFKATFQGNTLTVTLPRIWTKQNKIKQNTVLEILRGGGDTDVLIIRKKVNK